VTGIGADIFIVHGRDDATKQTVARFIEKLRPGLLVMILHEQANAGSETVHPGRSRNRTHRPACFLTVELSRTIWDATFPALSSKNLGALRVGRPALPTASMSVSLSDRTPVGLLICSWADGAAAEVDGNRPQL